MLKPIRSNSDYESALVEAYELIQKGLKANSQDAAYLEALSVLIEAYEKQHFPIAPPHPIDAILFRLEQMNMTTADLKKYLGYRSRVSEILSGQRKLSLKMIRTLHEKLKIPADVLIKEYRPVKSVKRASNRRTQGRKPAVVK